MATEIGEREVERADESPHEHGGEAGWTEALRFWFVDPASRLAGIAVMEFEPATRNASSSLTLLFPDGTFARAIGRAQNAKRAELSVGRLSFVVERPMQRWGLKAKDVALVFPTGAAPSDGARAGSATQISIDLAFEAYAPAAGRAWRRAVVNDQKFLQVVSSGTFAQPGWFAGTVKAGARTFEIDGVGVRERTWGVRVPSDTAPAAGGVVFSPDLAFTARAHTLTGNTPPAGVSFRDRTPAACEVRSTTSGSAVSFTFTQGASLQQITGEPLATIEPRTGEDEPRYSLVRFRLDDQEALGIVEH